MKSAPQISNIQVAYNTDELSLADVYTKSLSLQLKNATYVCDTIQAASTLGKFWAK